MRDTCVALTAVELATQQCNMVCPVAIYAETRGSFKCGTAEACAVAWTSRPRLNIEVHVDTRRIERHDADDSVRNAADDNAIRRRRRDQKAI